MSTGRGGREGRGELTDRDSDIDSFLPFPDDERQSCVDIHTSPEVI